MRALISGVVILATCSFVLPADAAKKWRAKEDCTLIANGANDGDSFHVRIGRRHYIIRLLWVDAPETDNRYPERVAEQAAYFGISPADAIKVGKEAARFTQDFLSRQPFTVYTQFADARGSSGRDRDYGIVKSGDTYLMDALVSNGLARIHGMEAVPEDGPSESVLRMRLKGFENDAKRNKRGAWAYGGASLNRFEQLNRPPEIRQQTLTLARSTPIYSADDSTRVAGTLAAGTSVLVLRAESAQFARVRFTLSDGRTLEGLARLSDLNLQPR